MPCEKPWCCRNTEELPSSTLGQIISPSPSNTETRLPSVCIDSRRGIFAVAKTSTGPRYPIHVQKCTWGAKHCVICELEKCNRASEFSQRSGFMGFESFHLRSLAFSPVTAMSDITLQEEVLTRIIQAKWFGKETMKTCLHRKQMAETQQTPLSKEISLGEEKSQIYLSVFEPHISFRSRLGRMMVHYNKKLNTWHCASCKPVSSCIHKAISKWHLYQTRPEHFKKVKTTGNDVFGYVTIYSGSYDSEQQSCDVCYAPRGHLLVRLVQYIQRNKTIPDVLPCEICATPKMSDFPMHLIPYETFCAQCPRKVPLSDPIPITHKGKIIMFSGIVIGLSHYAVNSFLSNIDVKEPPPDFKREVDMEDFWKSVEREILGRGFVKCNRDSPFVILPSYHQWAPWIGPQTRANHIVANTEYAKVHVSNKCQDEGDIDITEERLTNEVMNLKVNTIRKLCKQCKLDSKGSKMDLVMRLRAKMQTRSTYDKVFQKVWGASGGWAVIMCPCGVVYSVKFNIRAESPRDYADMLPSWMHILNVVVYDFARGLVNHCKLWEPERPLFNPNEEQLTEATCDNIEMAVKENLKINLPWLNAKKVTPDLNGHPVTGSAEHYALCMIHFTNTTQRMRRMRKNNYFLNMLSPSAHVFLMKSIIHQHNQSVNQKALAKLRKICPGTLQAASLAPSPPSPSAVHQAITSPVHSISHPGTFQAACPATAVTFNVENDKFVSIRFIMDIKLSQTERLLEVGGVWLTSLDFKTIGPESWMESTGKDIYMGDLYVTATWGPPRNLDPLQSLPVLNLKQKEIYFLDSFYEKRDDPEGFGDISYVAVCRRIAQHVSPGQWKSRSGFDIGLPSQMNSNDCGIFMLMNDMPALRKWWCIMSLENSSPKGKYSHWTELNALLNDDQEHKKKLEGLDYMEPLMKKQKMGKDLNYI
ncbi:LOW QUALITY PROTEIN: uncharacterized protein LOC120524435 [Polypterus senegalus]|uniref:LOW QUALITY PROTEIN: uncharacterized protein LOC120524435 n=1 Tax=Polypterus senegalus TaxID=55291 RepID=UPI0019629DD4|nr:LOW QUALITY PROTEIN: uncharacterized protein LOC120524435 [Polypterus senegalus]